MKSEIISLILFAETALGAYPEQVVYHDNVKYEIVKFWGYDTSEAVVTGFAEGYIPEGELSFPDELTVDGETVPVVGLGWSNHAGHEGDEPVVGGFEGITSVHIPRHMRFIGRIEFRDCPNIEKYTVETGSETYTTINDALVEILTYTNEPKHELVRYPSAATAASYTVPAKIDYISFGAFAANRSLRTLYLINGQSLQTCWQYNNKSIEEVNCRNSNRYRVDDDGALYDGSVFVGLCPARKYDTFTMPESCRYIDDGAFCNSSVDHIVMASSVGYAPTNCFMGSDVRTVTFSNGAIPAVRECAFMDCRNLEAISLGHYEDGRVEIGTCAFRGCESLQTVNLDEGIRNIDMSTRAFEGCRSLTAFPLTSKMKIAVLDSRAFAGCESLTSFSFGCVSEFTNYNGHQFAGSGLKQVHWPTGFSVIPRGCFADCKQLTKVYLKDTTEDLYEDAFAGSGLVALNMMGVDWYSQSAFADCPDLMRLYFPDNGKTIYYCPINFMAPDPQILVDNPKMKYLSDQDEFPGKASLYISMVEGGVTIGDGWRKVYVPGEASDLYSQLTAAEVEEMFTLETYPEEGAVAIRPAVTGVKIKSVAINDEEAVLSDGRYTISAPTAQSTMNVTVNYTVFNNPMTSDYHNIRTSPVEETVQDMENPGYDTPVEWYTLTGIPVDGDTPAPGVYLRKKGHEVSKVLVK